MSNDVFDDLIDHRWTPSFSWQRLHPIEPKSVAQRNEEFLDEVPAMSGTVLCLEMLIHEPSIDLQLASELVLSDIGATIQIMRLIGKAYDFDEDRPRRMGDCLASLEVSVWFGAISARTFPCDRDHAEMAALWKHCRQIAQYAEIVAESLDCASPDDAYLVGLFHGIGAIPALLGWSEGGAAALSVMEAALPLVVLKALRSVSEPGPQSCWGFILNAAHELAGSRQDLVAAPTHDPESGG